jgi:dTDP-4-amino-4,6-dideoxygalactose transaminase
MKLRANTTWNYSYYPIIFKTKEILLKVQKALNESQIFPRRYFYPSLNTLNYVGGQKMPVSESIASRILCLPLYSVLKENELDLICTLINKELC